MALKLILAVYFAEEGITDEAAKEQRWDEIKYQWYYHETDALDIDGVTNGETPNINNAESAENSFTFMLDLQNGTILSQYQVTNWIDTTLLVDSGADTVIYEGAPVVADGRNAQGLNPGDPGYTPTDNDQNAPYDVRLKFYVASI